MHSKIKKIIKNIIPPILCQIINRLKLTYSGNYKSWVDALKKSGNYNNPSILDKVYRAALDVKLGKAAFERDSVLFFEHEYSWPLLSSLLFISSQSCGKLNIIDFGGSLGSTFYQNKKILTILPSLKWNIIEQKHFVDLGKKEFESAELKFYYDLETCLKESNPNSILMSGVIQYLEKPYELLDKIIGLNLEYIIIDRMPFLFKGADRLTIQKVDPKIYNASYPCWFFNKNKFLDNFKDKYEMIAEFKALAGRILINNKETAEDLGMIFKRI